MTGQAEADDRCTATPSPAPGSDRGPEPHPGPGADAEPGRHTELDGSPELGGRPGLALALDMPAATGSGVGAAPRSQTLATWFAVIGGSLGLHRFYLHGLADPWGWLLWPPTLTGAYGIWRMNGLGQDDRLAWLLIPGLGLVLAATMLTAIVYGLMPAHKWNARFNRRGVAPSVPWLNVLGAITALALGSTALIASIAFMAQRFFEYSAS